MALTLDLTYFAVVVTVPTGAGSAVTLMSLIKAARPTSPIRNSCTVAQITAAKANTGTVWTGDSTLEGTTLTGTGVEMAAGEGYFEPWRGGGFGSIDLTEIYVQGSVASQKLLLRVWR